jgi:hypothetical protein
MTSVLIKHEIERTKDGMVKGLTAMPSHYHRAEKVDVEYAGTVQRSFKRAGKVVTEHLKEIRTRSGDFWLVRPVSGSHQYETVI